MPESQHKLALVALLAAGCGSAQPATSSGAGISNANGDTAAPITPSAGIGGAIAGSADSSFAAGTGGTTTALSTSAGAGGTTRETGAAGTTGSSPATGSGGSIEAGAGGTAAAGKAAPIPAAGVGGAASVDEMNCAFDASNGTSTPSPLTLSGNTFAHDPTMIEVQGTFYRFWTGDFIPSATSTDLRHWSNAPAVYRDRYPAWSREWLAGVPDQTFNFPWAPDVSHFGGTFHLYSSFSAKFGANTSCITHLTATDIASNDWTDHGPVICSSRTDRYNAIDADVGFDGNGDPWMAFGSFWDGIMLLPLDEKGARKNSDSPTRIAWAPEIEAPVLFRRCKHFYLFVSHGKCCPSAQRRVADLTYHVVVGRSDNIRGPYLDREGRPLLEEGGTLVVAGDRSTFAAAGHSDILTVGDRVYHAYHAYRLPRGDAELRIVEMRFDADGWPIPTSP